MERKYFEILVEINGTKYAVREEYDIIESWKNFRDIGTKAIRRLIKIIQDRENLK